VPYDVLKKVVDSLDAVAKKAAPAKADTGKKKS
jgi:hypothetical protein